MQVRCPGIMTKRTSTRHQPPYTTPRYSHIPTDNSRRYTVRPTTVVQSRRQQSCSHADNTRTVTPTIVVLTPISVVHVCMRNCTYNHIVNSRAIKLTSNKTLVRSYTLSGCIVIGNCLLIHIWWNAGSEWGQDSISAIMDRVPVKTMPTVSLCGGVVFKGTRLGVGAPSCDDSAW